MLTLAALARLQNERVVFQWCTGAPEDLDDLPHLRMYVPEWHGFHYSPADFLEVIAPPAEIIISENLTSYQRNLPKVGTRWGMDSLGVQEVNKLDAVYSYAWRVYQLGDTPASQEEFRASYVSVCSPMVAHARKIHASRGSYVVVHLRLSDDNTYSPYPSEFENGRLYCTGAMIARLLDRGYKLLAVSNDNELALDLLDGRVEVISADPIHDFSLMLGAAGIVQHAWRGWSSFSSVPALAAGIPMITTFKGTHHHRLDFFKEYGLLPREMHTCNQMDKFERALGIQ